MTMDSQDPWNRSRVSGAVIPGGFDASKVLPVGTPRVISNPVDAFQDAAVNAGLRIDQVIHDGQIHRVPDGTEKPGKASGWYIYFDGKIAAGAFGSWKGDWKQTWSAKADHEMMVDERADYRERLKQLKAAQEKERQQRQDEARARAQHLDVKDADPNHPYLQKKQVKPYGIHQQKDMLIVPMQDADRTLHNVQRIFPDGTKRFLKGGRIQGCFYQIGSMTPVIYIVEGFATGASITELVDGCVIVAFNAGNLKPVAEALRKEYPLARIIFAADNDQFTDGNPGITKANEAAQAVKGSVVYPVFTDLSTKPTDFNDLACLEGIEAVRTQLKVTAKEDDEEYGELDPDTQPLSLSPATRWADRQLREIEWVLPDWIPIKQTTALYAAGGTGKSLFAQQLMTCVATGHEFMGMQVRKGAALGFFCEDDEDILHSRQDKINKALGLSYRDYGDMIPISRVGYDNLLMTFDGKDAGYLTPFWHQIARAVRQVKPVLLIIDTAADTFGGNENVRGEVRQYIQRSLTKIAIEHNCAVLVLAHPSASGLNSGSGTGGSTAWENTVRSRIYMKKDDDGARITVSRMKSNYAKSGESFDVFWCQGVLQRYADMAALKDAGIDIGEAEIDEDFLAMLRHYTHVNRQQVSNNQRGNYAPKLFARHWKVACKQKRTVMQFEDAMERLVAGGEVIVTSGARKDRSLALVLKDDYGNGS